MHANGYRRPKTSPAAVVAAIAVNIGMVALIATSAPSIFVVPDPGIAVRNIPIDEPPPPVPEDRTKPDVRTLPTDRPPTIPDRIVDVPITPLDGIAGTDVIGPPPGPGPIGDGARVAVDPPLPAPVLVDAAPDPRAQFQPDYPASERRAGTEGNVTVRVLIGTDGRVKAVEQVRSAAPAFFEATRRQALARWRFRPATRDGVPVESWRTMTLRFVLEG